MSKKTAPIQKPIEVLDFLSVNLPKHAIRPYIEMLEDSYYKTEMINGDINKSSYYQRLKAKVEKGKAYLIENNL